MSSKTPVNNDISSAVAIKNNPRVNVCLLTSIYKTVVRFSLRGTSLARRCSYDTRVRRYCKTSFFELPFAYSAHPFDAYLSTRLLSMSFYTRGKETEVEHTFRALVYFGDMLRNEICVRFRDIKHRATAKVKQDASRISFSEFRVDNVRES